MTDDKTIIAKAISLDRTGWAWKVDYDNVEIVPDIGPHNILKVAQWFGSWAQAHRPKGAGKEYPDQEVSWILGGVPFGRENVVEDIIKIVAAAIRRETSDGENEDG